MPWRLVAATGGAAMFGGLEMTGHPLITLPLVHEVLPALPLGLCTCAPSCTVHAQCTHSAYTEHTQCTHAVSTRCIQYIGPRIYCPPPSYIYRVYAQGRGRASPTAVTWAAALHATESVPAMRGGSDVASSAADTHRRSGAQPARRSVTARAGLHAVAVAVAGGGGGSW